MGPTAGRPILSLLFTVFILDFFAQIRVSLLTCPYYASKA